MAYIVAIGPSMISAGPPHWPPQGRKAGAATGSTSFATIDCHCRIYTKISDVVASCHKAYHIFRGLVKINDTRRLHAIFRVLSDNAV